MKLVIEIAETPRGDVELSCSGSMVAATTKEKFYALAIKDVVFATLPIIGKLAGASGVVATEGKVQNQ
jgi:hypothetical protein